MRCEQTRRKLISGVIRGERLELSSKDSSPLKPEFLGCLDRSWSETAPTHLMAVFMNTLFSAASYLCCFLMVMDMENRLGPTYDHFGWEEGCAGLHRVKSTVHNTGATLGVMISWLGRGQAGQHRAQEGFLLPISWDEEMCGALVQPSDSDVQDSPSLRMMMIYPRRETLLVVLVTNKSSQYFTSYRTRLMDEQEVKSVEIMAHSALITFG